MISRLMALAERACTHPHEALDFITGALETRWEAITLRAIDYTIIPWGQAIDGLEAASGQSIKRYLDEAPLHEIRAEVGERLKRIGGQEPFPAIYNADTGLSALCYALVRAFRPEIIVVTGVAYGLVIGYLLMAQQVNGSGVLHAIDLPPLFPGAEGAVGALIPEKMRPRLNLHRGASQRVLPRLLGELGGVDFFVHDSLHTYGNIRRELSAITPCLRSPGLVVVDDSNQNPALRDWQRQYPPTFGAVLQEADKDAMCGIALFMPEGQVA